MKPLLSILALLTLPAVLLAAQSTRRVSLDSLGGQGFSGDSSTSSVSASGQVVAFLSYANTLVGGDSNNAGDIFAHDRSTGSTIRVSVDSSGAQSNDGSNRPDVSADGRVIAFDSLATNLVVGDSNGVQDVFVHDRQSGTTRRVSLSSAGSAGNGASSRASISANGRYVAFDSLASNLVTGDTNGAYDVFVHDLQSAQTTRVSVASGGAQASSGQSWNPSISQDGRFVSFQSDANNLVAGDTNVSYDVFVHDRLTGTTTRVSVSSSAAQGGAPSTEPAISSNGRYVAFQSSATNLVAGDANVNDDIFVHDRQIGQTTRVSLSSSGSEADGFSSFPDISSNGRFVAFESTATNLVGDDTNSFSDVFVHDRLTGETTRVSVDSTGAQASYYSSGSAISGDGRCVSFNSWAWNLVADDTNGFGDVFLREIARRKTVLGTRSLIVLFF